jgi:lipid A disaccharide synthetase
MDMILMDITFLKLNNIMIDENKIREYIKMLVEAQTINLKMLEEHAKNSETWRIPDDLNIISETRGKIDVLINILEKCKVEE